MTGTDYAGAPFASTFNFTVVARTPPAMQTARLFVDGSSQVVRLPAEFCLTGGAPYPCRDPVAADIIPDPRRRRFVEGCTLGGTNRL